MSATTTTGPVVQPRGARARRTTKHLPEVRFGSLVIIERNGVAKGSQRVLCRCDCGSLREYNLSNLLTGATARCSDRQHHPHPRHKGRAVTYDGAHTRVKRSRGSAQGHACVSCGKPAAQWAYSHADPHELAMPSGREARRPYSPDPEHYDPRCRACHTRWDRAEHRITQGQPPRTASLVHVALWAVTHPESAAA